MDKHLGKEYPDGMARKTFLKDNCDCVVEKGYMKAYTPEELGAMKNDLAETSIQINDIEEEKKEAMAEFKRRLEPHTDKRKELLEGIKQKAKYVKEECFKFVDHDERMTGFYNADGDLIESRPANPDEMQTTIYSLSRTGTTD